MQSYIIDLWISYYLLLQGFQPYSMPQPQFHPQPQPHPQVPNVHYQPVPTGPIVSQPSADPSKCKHVCINHNNGYI